MKQRLRNKYRVALALPTALMAMSLGFASPAMAAIDGGGIGGGGGEGGKATHFFLSTFDDFKNKRPQHQDPTQGWEQDSINWHVNELMSIPGFHFPDYNRNEVQDKANEACGIAMEKARQRAATEEGNPNAKTRVVQIGIAAHPLDGGGYSLWGSDPNDFRKWYNDWWGDAKGRLQGYSDEWLNKVHEAFESNIAPSNARVTCVAVNEYEPPDPTYTMSVSTDIATHLSNAGTSDALKDTIHVSNNGSSVQENVNANVILNWDNPEGGVRQVTKQMQLPNNGDVTSPDFVPSDFGWKSWPAGNYWFDVQVPKQGMMDGDVDTADRDPRESTAAQPAPPKKSLHAQDDSALGDRPLVAGQFYTAKIAAPANGYSRFRITDTIHTEDVVIGGRDSDDTSKVKVVNSAGQPVDVTVKVTRSGGNTVVSAEGAAGDISDTYTLMVPTYVKPTKKDYTIPDDSQVCYPTVTPENCQKGNSETTRKITPTPDKVWTLDEAGALNAQDPNWTNNVSADQKTFNPTDPISAVVNGHIPANLSAPMPAYQIVDDWTGAAQYVNFGDAKKAKVFKGKEDITGQFTIRVEGTKTVADAKPEFLASTKGLSADQPIKLVISGEFRSDYDTKGDLKKLTNAGWEVWGTERKDTNTPPVFTVTPDPNKVWTLNQAGALVANDPNWTNNVSADGKTFFMNDAVSAVVNGTIPANKGRAFTSYVITDDWTDSAKFVDFSDVSKAKVFRAGTDITGQFTIRVEGTKTIAEAKPEFLASTKGLASDVPIKLVISGKFRDDYDTNGKIVRLTNSGSEAWNGKTSPTNTPPVFTWTPDPPKDVLASATQDGDQSSINGLSVYPGQWLEYKVGVDLRWPGNTAYGDNEVKSLAVLDTYDKYFTPNKSSVEFYDTRDNTVVPRSQYTLAWDDERHQFTATFKEEWVKKNANVNREDGWLILRFDGKVNKDTPMGSTVRNQAFQIVNGAKTATEKPSVTIPTPKPDKEDLNTKFEDIDGKTLVQGDTALYRMTLDAGPSRDKLAYDVHKLGMVDDYDEKYLSVDAKDIKILEYGTNKNVTDMYNVQVKNGKAYMFAKLVDRVNSNGEKIAAQQPKDLEAYANAAIDPVNDAGIDQSMLGKKYWILMPAKVIKETDGYVIKNKAIQNIENSWLPTKMVSNPLKDIDPSKDVVISEETKGDSINGQEVKLDDVFNYRLNSSVIPANRAYEVSNWSLSDTFDREHDLYLGKWAVYANRDVYDGKKLVFKKGDLLADDAGHESEAFKGLFKVTWDEDSYTLKVEATDAFRKLVNSRGDLEAAFSVYTRMQRIAPSERVENKTTETYNDVKRESNIVYTHTPEHPGIDVEKYTLDEGMQAGDRDEQSQAYEVGKDQPVKVGIKVTNTGDVKLVNVKISDATQDGTTGQVRDITCTEGKLPASEITELAAGESVDCVGVLADMSADSFHADTVTATGESVFTGKKVEDSDAWWAHLKGEPPVDMPKGAVTGSALTMSKTGWVLAGVGLIAVAAAAAGGVLWMRRKK